MRSILNLTRRRFLKWTGGIAVGGALGGVLDAFFLEPRWVRVSRPTVTIDNLPPAWDGVRIAHLTDLHHGRLIKLEFLRDVVDLANAESADIVALTGDFVSGRKAISTEYAAVLGRLQAPLGVFGVLGNHDHWADASAAKEMLASAGVRLIDNRGVVLSRGADQLALAGVGDLWAGQQDLGAAMRDVPDAAARVLLCHNPDYAERMPPDPRVDLMLAGHTHGGQIKIPFAGRPRLPIANRRYGAGLVAGPHCPVYVSVGIGMIGIPVRFNCRPELAVVTLRRGRA